VFAWNKFYSFIREDCLEEGRLRSPWDFVIIWNRNAVNDRIFARVRRVRGVLRFSTAAVRPFIELSK